MQEKIIYYAYAFILGIATAMLTVANPEAVVNLVRWPGYIWAGAFLLLAIASDRMERVGMSRRWISLILLVISAYPLGFTRYLDRVEIPAFDPDRPNHIRSVIDEFPDPDRYDRTVIEGRIVAEPEYRPAYDPNLPGQVWLTVAPEWVWPDPDSDEAYEVNEGNLIVKVSPRRAFSDETAEFEEYFEKLVRAEAYGYRVRFNAQVVPPQPAANPGLLDWEAFYGDQDIYGTMEIYYWNPRNPPIEELVEEEGNPLVEVSIDLKERILGVIKQTVPFPESAFLAGVTLGARRGLNNVRCIFEDEPERNMPDMRQTILNEFRWSGTSHVLAVSGLHVTIIGGMLLGIFTLLRIPRKLGTPFIVLALVVFCLLTGARPSTMRATLMNSLVLIVLSYTGSDLKASLLFAIAAAGLVILLENPKWLTAPAFSLSFMAVLSLGLLTGPIDRILVRIPGFKYLPSWFRQFTAAQGAIQLGMMWPLSAFYFCRVSLAGPFANFIAIPLIGVIVQLGLIAGLIGLIPGMVPIAMVLNATNYICIWFFLWTAHISTVIFPFPYVQTFTPGMILFYYLCLGVFIWWEPIRRRMEVTYYDIKMGLGDGMDRASGGAVIAIGFLLFGLVGTWALWPDAVDGMAHLNVLACGFRSNGFGESVHIRTPGGADILVNAGPNTLGGWNDGEAVVGMYLLKQRVGELDAFVVTGVSPEDIGGAGAILTNFPVRDFYAPYPIWDWDIDDPAAFRDEAEEAMIATEADDIYGDEVYRTTVHLADIAEALSGGMGPKRMTGRMLLCPTAFVSGVWWPDTHLVRSGTVIWEEEGEGGHFEILAIHPPNDDFDDLVPANERSVVLRVSYGDVSFLLPSDVTSEGISDLMRIDRSLVRSDVLLVPAHGHAEAFIPDFYEDVDPDTAVLQYGFEIDLSSDDRRGRGSDRDSFLVHRRATSDGYGDMIDRLKRFLDDRGTEVLQIEETGAVLLSTNGTDLFVTTMKGEDNVAAGAESGDNAIFREF